MSLLLTGHSMSTLVGREAGLSRVVPARPLLGAWLPAAWVVSALRSWACRRMIFPSNWFGDLEERGVQQHAVAAVLCVGAEMFLVFGEQSSRPTTRYIVTCSDRGLAARLCCWFAKLFPRGFISHGFRNKPGISVLAASRPVMCCAAGSAVR